MNTRRKTKTPRPEGRTVRRRWRALFLPIAAAVMVIGCDLEVMAPATVDEESLTDYMAIGAFVAGIQGQISYLSHGHVGPVGGTQTFGALRTDELVHSGHLGQYPMLRVYSDGDRLPEDAPDMDQFWMGAMKLRYLADFGVQRAKYVYEKYEDSSRPAEVRRVTRDRMRVYAWAGLAYRILGDNFCHAIIDGGPALSNLVFYHRGLAFLNEGIEFAETADVGEVDEHGLNAAYAVRAQIRLMLGDFEGAAEDAARIATGYGGLRTGGTGLEPGDRQRNWLRWIDFLEERNMTLWGTPFADWGYNTRFNTGVDMRVPFSDRQTGSNPHREWGGDDRRRWFRQEKELGVNEGWRVVHGREMRLIQAEALIRAGDLAGGMAQINELREWWNAPTGGRFAADGHPLEILEVPETQEEAWELLVRERGIELWLEGRRLPDIRRWQYDPGYVPTSVVRETMSGRMENDPLRNVLDIPGEFCLPIGATERRLNPYL